MASRLGNFIDQLRQFGGHLFDLFQRLAGFLGQPRAADHLGSAFFHGDHCFVGISLNGLDQGLNALGGVAGPLRQPLHLVGDHGEPATGVARRRSLDGGVQRQNIGLVGDVVDQRHDIADFLRGLAQSLDAFGGVLDMLTDGIHAVDGAPHPVTALVGDADRFLGHFGGGGGLGRNLVHGLGHLGHRGAGVFDLPGLNFAGFGQTVGDGAGFLHRGGDQPRSTVDRRHQVAQRFDGVVDRIGNRAGDVLGHAGLHRQVALGQIAQLVEQAQDGVLVAAVLILGFLLALFSLDQPLPAFTVLYIKQGNQQNQDQCAQHIGHLITHRNAQHGKLPTAFSVLIQQAGRGLQQGIAPVGDTLSRVLDLAQIG